MRNVTVLSNKYIMMSFYGVNVIKNHTSEHSTLKETVMGYLYF